MSRAAPRLDASISVGEQSLTLVLVAVLLSALATEFIGVHAIFGAFVFGAIIPHKSAIARHVREKIEDVVRVMFLPAFFAFTGLRTQIGLLQSVDDWLMCALIIAVATAGKFGGATLAARVSGLDWRNSAALGILMNTRGLVELIVLNIGLDLGVLTPRLFTMLVLMALVTTMMTSPILMALLRKQPWTETTTSAA
jgi:Kef-type K+ transport system membrane component KefB